LATTHQIRPIVIGRWKTQFLERAFEVFRKDPSDAEQVLVDVEKEEQIAKLERKVGQLTIEVDCSSMLVG